MSNIVYINGVYANMHDAKINIEDRGLQFADSVYEVIGVNNGKLLDWDLHYRRLERSLSEIQIFFTHTFSSLSILLEELVRKNRIFSGKIYIQVTRGTAKREHEFPSQTEPGLIITATQFDWPDPLAAKQDLASVVLLPDERWKRCDIKSTSLLANILAKQRAVEAMASEAWLYDSNNFITEGTASNAWIVDSNNALITRELGKDILAGVTRDVVINLAKSLKVKVLEKKFSRDDIKEAKEAFFTSSTALIRPVGIVDGIKIGNGTIGKVTSRLLDQYLNYLNNN